MSAVSIIRVENNKIIFDHEAFSRIINHFTIASKEICIISITGCFRKGKSFVLNFLLRYLQNIGNRNSNWIYSRSAWSNIGSPSFSYHYGNTVIADNSSPPLTGFPWKGGEDATTKGIVIWSEPYILKKDGIDVAILLMDTQGSFNIQDTLKKDADIFAISTLLSSVQIFNASNQLTEIELQVLEMFASYSRCYDANKEEIKPFQRLVYLIRDFQFEGKVGDGYGLEVGSEHWERRCSEITKAENIKSWFESFDCYVMPHPGNEVMKNNFNGCLHEIKEEKFVKHIQSFTEWMFLPKNLFTKKVMGKSLPNEKLIKLFQHYDNIFKDRKVPSPTSLMEAHLKTFYEHVEQKCINILDSDFDKFYDAKKVEDKLIDFCKEKDLWKSSVFNEFNKEFPAENSEVMEKYRQMLEIKFFVRLQDHYKCIMRTLQNDKETLQKNNEYYENQIDDNKKTIDKLIKQLNQQNERLRDEMLRKEALKKEKEEEIERKEKTIQELEKNENRLRNEKEKVIEESNREIQERDREIESAKLVANQFREEQEEVINERIRIIEAPDIENEAKNCIRSMTAYVKNETSCIFHLIDSKVSHGVWLESPPYTLLKKDCGKWASCSNGIFSIKTGGKIMYECKKCATNINFSWAIPLMGKNEYTNNSSNTFKHSVSSSGGGDYQVVFHYTIRGDINQ